MFNYKAICQWFKGFGIYLLKNIGYIIVLFLISYGIHLIFGLGFDYTLIACGAIVTFMGCSSSFGSMTIKNDYNYRMNMITNPALHNSEQKNQGDSSRFVVSCTIVGVTLLLIGFYI